MHASTEHQYYDGPLDEPFHMHESFMVLLRPPLRLLVVLACDCRFKTCHTAGVQ